MGILSRSLDVFRKARGCESYFVIMFNEKMQCFAGCGNVRNFLCGWTREINRKPDLNKDNPSMVSYYSPSNPPVLSRVLCSNPCPRIYQKDCGLAKHSLRRIEEDLFR